MIGNRSRQLASLAALSLLIGLSACGKKKAEPQTQTEPIVVSEKKAAIEVLDARGRTVTLDHPAIKIISLLPSLTEYLFQLDQGHLLIGRTNWCRYPKAAEAVEIVGGLENPVVETLVRLKPDLILAGPFLRNEQVNHLESLGLKIATFDHQNWETVVRDLKILGELLGNPGDVKTLIAWLGRQRQSIKDKVEEFGPEVPVKTLVLYALGPLYTSGPGTFVDEMIQLAGGENVAADLSSPWPMISMEGLIEKQPDVLLISTEAGAPDTLVDTIKDLSSDEVWGQLNAIKNNRVYILEGDPLAVPGSRQVTAMNQIAAALHPDLFEAPAELKHVNLLRHPKLP